MAHKLYQQDSFMRPPKEQQQAARQAGNDPLQDGFHRTEMVHNQPSEIKNMEMADTWDAEHQNVDIERTR